MERSQIINSNTVLGVLGGVGPLASSKFIQSIYFYHTHRQVPEQKLPKILLYSDPSIPDRTQYLNLGLHDVLLSHLIKGLDNLLNMGAEKLVICCFTLHHLQASLPHSILDHIISLPKLALDRIISLQKKSLILCTSATNRLRIFEASPNWNEASKFVIFPAAKDQQRIHETIYKLKKNMGYSEASELIKQLLAEYQADYWVVGCTEYHLMSHYLLFEAMREHSQNDAIPSRGKVTSIIDPLLIIADLINEEFSGDTECLKNTNQIFSRII